MMATAHDEWDDSGAFLYRMMPEAGLDAFFTEEREMLTISRDHGEWWLGEPGQGGQQPFKSLAAAKKAGDAIVEKAERDLDAKLLNEAGLDAARWSVSYGDGIQFEHSDRPYLIEGDTRDGMAGQQRWTAYNGEDRMGRAQGVGEALALLEPLEV